MHCLRHDRNLLIPAIITVFALLANQASANESASNQVNGEREFDEFVITESHSVPIVVEFYADWCGYCQELKPMLEEAAAEVKGRLRVVRVDADENEDLALRFGVSGLPTLIFFDDGMALNRIDGVPDTEWLHELFSSYASELSDSSVEE